MSSPRHSPPRSAPRPKGILKNASERAISNTVELDDNGNRLAWDETNLTLHEIERENTAARMKIDEPKTPFVRSASLDSEVGGFELDSGASSYFGNNTSQQLAANTNANATRTSSNAEPAVGLDAVELQQQPTSPSTRSTSRSPSFSLPPGSRRSSSASARVAANNEARSALRGEQRDRMDLDGDEAVGPDNDDDDELDPEAQAKQAAFAQKRNQHYGNEAEAMKIAAALASKDEDEDEEDQEELSIFPPVPTPSNGRNT